jgi:ATP-binding cassette subfamily C (CFTR/MRP) protein 1
MAATIPVTMIALYLIQKFYLRTSKQLRILDLEARSPLYQHFTETLEGLATIRAFRWQNSSNSRALQILDDSQRPYYLLYCIQRWLNLVLDLIVGALAVLLVALALCVQHNTSSGSLGVALTSVLAFNQTLQSLIESWTQAETSLGANSRIMRFENSTPQEVDEDHIDPGSDWPLGVVQISNLAVKYSYDSDPMLFTLTQLTVHRNDTTALQNISIHIQVGQKIGIIGRSGR